jgi:hypothetical protein
MDSNAHYYLYADCKTPGCKARLWLAISKWLMQDFSLGRKDIRRNPRADARDCRQRQAMKSGERIN